jgi:uncharacterized membrane protein YfcA
VSPADAAWLVAAGLGAGLVNGVAGGGSLVSFPVLLALGYPAVTANVTSAVGIWPGYVGGTAGFRKVLAGQRRLLRSLAVVSVGGAVVGAALLLALPSDSFRAVVPYLLLFACVLFAAQPALARRLRSEPGTARSHLVARQVATFGAAVYGAYFGAGLGVVLLAVLGLTLAEPLVRINGVRAALTLLVNTVAVAIFLVLAPVDWAAAAVMAGASLVGGYAGAHLAQRIPTTVLRAVVIVVGLAAAIRLLMT